MTHRVIFSPEAEAQLAALFEYIESEASLAIADRYVDAIIRLPEALGLSKARNTT